MHPIILYNKVKSNICFFFFINLFNFSIEKFYMSNIFKKLCHKNPIYFKHPEYYKHVEKLCHES